MGLLRKTPVHPQWFAFLREDKNLRASCKALNGLVLDIGCAEGKPRRYLPETAEYLGLDYFDTATAWYKTRPSVFGDAQQLPFANDTVDHVLLLDVLEHLPGPDRCHPTETAALAANIAISKTVLNWIATRNPLAILAILLPPLILVRNCLAWLTAALSRSDDMMPYSYRMVWVKA